MALTNPNRTFISKRSFRVQEELAFVNKASHSGFGVVLAKLLDNRTVLVMQTVSKQLGCRHKGGWLLNILKTLLAGYICIWETTARCFNKTIQCFKIFSPETSNLGVRIQC